MVEIFHLIETHKPFLGIYLWSLSMLRATDITFRLLILILNNDKNVTGTVSFNKTIC